MPWQKEENHKNFSQIKQPLVPNLNPEHPHYKVAALTTHPHCLIQRKLICLYEVTVPKLNGWAD
jgi:hypothetical protein